MRDVNQITPSFTAGCQSPSLTKPPNYPFRSHFEPFHSWPRNDSIYVSNLQLLLLSVVMLLPVIVIMAHKVQQEKRKKKNEINVQVPHFFAV